MAALLGTTPIAIPLTSMANEAPLAAWARRVTLDRA
jgi:hypothetical protein